MAKHHTRNTVSFTAYCKKCKMSTPHRVDGTRPGPCLRCIDILNGKDVSQPERKGFTVEIPNCCQCHQYTFPHYHHGSKSIKEYDEACARANQ